MASVTAEAAEAHAEAHDPHATNTGISNNKLGMWVFLGSECLLFGGLISTYLLYEDADTLQRTPADVGARFFDIPFTSVSSFVLLMSSLTMVLALSAINRGDYYRSKLWTLTTALLGSTFIAGQIYEFTVFLEEGLGFTTSIFSSAFFTLTGFHGVHVTVGLVMLVSSFVMQQKGRLNKSNAENLEIVGLYWHFVDIVWVLIFVVVYLIPYGTRPG